MTKAQIDQYIEREALKMYWPHDLSYKDIIRGANLLTPLLLEAIAALEFECGNRCAQGINPCNAREVLDKIQEAIK